jgi:phage terminase large subunit-like protein
MRFTARQEEAQAVIAGPATHSMLFGGSRSGKTFLHVRNTVFRALKAPASRHGLFRFRLNHIKASILMDTFPKVMRLAFPGVHVDLSKTDFVATFPNESQVWFAGLDDKERTEKVLGQEFATLMFNECSQIPFGSVQTALTRLAQLATVKMKGRPDELLKPRVFYDCNPPPKSHWTYQLFVLKRDPETLLPLATPDDYVALQMNPQDNAENLAPGYLRTLAALSPRLQKRFLRGEFADANPNALFPDEVIDRWRHLGDELPQMVRIVVAVDPSGSGDVDNADNDEIGIIVAGLGIDGDGYVLEDCTVKAGPATWGRVSTQAFDRHMADTVVGEVNFGGAMVEHVIQTSRPRTPFKAVTASRGKAVRAEPISALYEAGKVHHVGVLRQLEDELADFSTVGFVGTKSPNRADALIWALTALFPALTKGKKRPARELDLDDAPGHWMAV